MPQLASAPIGWKATACSCSSAVEGEHAAILGLPLLPLLAFLREHGVLLR